MSALFSEYRDGRPGFRGFGGVTSGLALGRRLATFWFLLAVPEGLFLVFGTVRFMVCFFGVMVFLLSGCLSHLASC